ncbi:DNA-binding response regulator [Anaerocolumna cellulosilytica]|uniref:Stage 0 sporulation protein A homolog n=1 Tax=Anaerocolumna cellulosilytica TaxID=433286 RepID=A0A6S6QZL7_9FIRM|nr:LytTR family DNA-binding domain-containing protein [Anaerocolumna cellulosilytica]MBB5196131.1 DNA-binding LytR/AlgR family response regulator [Anaerocolumna cellulosilytica]BCJ92550.1 DNA-binding response regulator [Anaerocolumna cellulosilytica]
MLTIAICDNNTKDSKKIEAIVKGYMDTKCMSYRMYCYNSGEELLAFRIKFDLVFLDIAMDGINGIQAGRKLREMNRNVKIVYTTSYQQYCIQAVNKVHAFAYLEKPVTKEKAEYQLNEIIQYIKEEKEKMKTINFEVVEITEEGKLETRIKNFEVNDIYYFEYLNRKIKIRLEQEEYFFVYSMKELAQKMKLYDFTVCHQCYLVNLRHVKKIKGYEVFLDGSNEVLPVSQKKSAEFRKKLNQFIHSSL